jgi:hypothetical protein
VHNGSRMGVPAFAVAPNARDLMKGMPGEFPGLAKLAIFIAFRLRAEGNEHKEAQFSIVSTGVMKSPTLYAERAIENLHAPTDR